MSVGVLYAPSRPVERLHDAVDEIAELDPSELT